ncbi:hypothetical protein PQR05_29225 [Paraburkholderia sediminicola]|uniref:hypothetical protein n=1 Tax=Paraburkholderia sediminicola TaxID=458836 RepID=UPI0038BE1DAC
MEPENDGPFAVRHGKQSEWDIEARPAQVGGMWRANSHAIRRPTEDGDDLGDSLTFSDLGDYATQAEAIERATQWTLRWIEENSPR